MKAVLFDMDGVLIDSETFYMEGTYIWMKELGFTGTYEDICTVIGTSMKTTYEMLQKMLKNKYSIKEIENRNVEYFNENPIDYKKIMIKGTLDLIKHLHNNDIKLAVCSSSPKENIDHVMEVCGFKEYLDFDISGEQLKHSKPAPDIYLKASEVLNVDPLECIVIEDSSIGIESGKNANMHVVAYKDYRFNQDQSKADKVFSSMKEIQDYIDTLIAK
ncbi:MAG: HAD family phosphatase [Erysipelotrichaceae bacterium]|nr:HAD family phosphatase [Erysipelotrichaceae bacterium]